MPISLKAYQHLGALQTDGGIIADSLDKRKKENLIPSGNFIFGKSISRRMEVVTAKPSRKAIVPSLVKTSMSRCIYQIDFF